MIHYPSVIYEVGNDKENWKKRVKTGGSEEGNKGKVCKEAVIKNNKHLYSAYNVPILL